ncbi:hypothetical protein EDB81DRAFT_898609 [Dactylonectria macrodidyma]|uniref:Uncharacterized protein n=1 Tax=Dactylonectria macrodidyma TaxID=307937 RepID=A0A9P9JJS4_9HYPO|nr:hypothetical protein EDB81DRAFT_898609 [Dactylonectria macrodidyma]
MRSTVYALALSATLFQNTHATLTAYDASDDYAGTYDVTTDNTLLSDFDFAPVFYLKTALKSTHSITSDTTWKRKTLNATANDTSVIITTDSTFRLSYSDVYKTGYSSDLYQASFFGVNAAVNANNDSIVYLDHVNITTHNGAANVYAYGTGTEVEITDSYLYSSGPVAHGLYAAGNATIIADNVVHYSGGYRSSAFAGDVPDGDLNITNSVSHTTGIGSAIFYVSGHIYGKNVIGQADKAPVVIMDGDYSIELYDCQLTTGNLGGLLHFSSGTRTSSGTWKIVDSIISSTNDAVSTLWFGNVISNMELTSVKLLTSSGVLVAANTSQITQDFSYFASPAEISTLLPAIATIDVADSELDGDLLAINGSTINWSLSDYSSWTGKTVSETGTGYFNVALDSSSSWSLTGDSYTSNFTNGDSSMDNIQSNGYNLYYSKSAALSESLNGEKIELQGGGYLTPY